MNRAILAVTILILSFLAVIFVQHIFFTSRNKISEPIVTANGNPLDPKNLPLGDGRISDTPQKGYVMPCQTRFFGGGAFRDGNWIRSDGTWDSTAKPEVDGDVAWDGKYEIMIEDGKRKLIGNGLPSDHHTGVFPISRNDDAYNYDRNPNSIGETKIVYELPLLPTVADTPNCVPMGAIGVMKTGVMIFNSLDAQGKDAVAHEIQDKCNGHPERDGHYHYHNLSKCVEDKQTKKHSELVGYALDGFGIYGVYGENGKELTNADLDECHGHTHEILWDGKLVNLYHYHATKEYPYTVGCFRGTPAVKNESRPRGIFPRF